MSGTGFVGGGGGGGGKTEPGGGVGRISSGRGGGGAGKGGGTRPGGTCAQAEWQKREVTITAPQSKISVERFTLLFDLHLLEQAGKVRALKAEKFGRDRESMPSAPGREYHGAKRRVRNGERVPTGMKDYGRGHHFRYQLGTARIYG
jgi:hypothetical protein